MIQPFAPPGRASAERPQQQESLVYEIVESEQLPHFDASVRVEHLFMNDEQVQRFQRISTAVKLMSLSCFFTGILVRNFVLFVPARIGKILGLVCLLAETPTNVSVLVGFRCAYLKLLTNTFEFCFVVLSATVWVVCACVYVPDARATVFPSVVIGFIHLVLVEAFDETSSIVSFVAFTSSVYLLVMAVGVMLNVVPHATNEIVLLPGETYNITTRDLLLNAMGTVIMLTVRLAHRNYVAFKREKGKASPSHPRSNGYRCRIVLRARGANPMAGLCQPATDPSRASSRSNIDSSRIKMRFIKISRLFHASDTVVNCANRFLFTRWKLWALYTLGGVGYTASFIVALYPARRDESSNVITAAALAIIGLCATILVLLTFTCCSQRALLRELFTSFDFVFLYAQLIAGHLSACDALMWNWVHCCSLLTSFLWMHWVLTLDALTPDMKARLRLKSRYAALILLLNLSKGVLFGMDIFV